MSSLDFVALWTIRSTRLNFYAQHAICIIAIFRNLNPNIFLFVTSGILFFFFFPLATFQKLAAALRQTIQSCTVIEDCFDAVNYQINIRVWSS